MADSHNCCATDQAAKDKVWEMIKDIRIAQFVTQDRDGKLYSRPMAAHQDKFHGELWFFTDKNSPKIDEIQNKQHVLVSYADPKSQHYVSINGTAEIVTDRAKIAELWNEHLRTWFPKGKDDPAIALICVTMEQAEYWDSQQSAFLYAYGYAKAVLTGQRPEGGENEKVTFDKSAA